MFVNFKVLSVFFSKYMSKKPEVLKKMREYSFFKKEVSVKKCVSV